MSVHVAIFGGAFDPPHLGHQAVCLHILATEDVDEVWWMPSPVHAFGKRCAPFHQRVTMCCLATQAFSPQRVRVSDVEAGLPAPQCTVDTVAHLLHKHPQHVFSLVIGSDNVSEIERWKDIERLRSMTRFVVVPRSGAATPENQQEKPPRNLLPQISSSAVRKLLASNESIAGLVDRKVALYISEHGLYKGSSGGGL